MRTLMLGIALLSLMAACGSNDRSAPGEPDEWDDDAYATMLANPSYEQVQARYTSCMHEAGYPEVDIRKGIILKDGSVIREGAGPLYLRGAYLEYALTVEGCEQSTGLSAVRADFGFANPTLAPGTQKRLNDNVVREMACMEGKGWDIPEPVTSRGLLIFDIQFDSEEQKTAYNVDFYRCLAELGTWNP